MPTKWKRYRCAQCLKIIVAWKLRKFFGRHYCSACIDEMFLFSSQYYKVLPSKAKILKSNKIISVKKVSKSTQNFGS